MTINSLLIIAPDFYPVNGGYANAITNFVKSLAEFNPQLKITVITLSAHDCSHELEIDSLFVNRVAPVASNFRYRAILDAIRLGREIKKQIQTNKHDYVLFETFENPIAIWLALKDCTKEQLKSIAIRVHGCTETEVYLDSRRWIHRLSLHLTKKLLKIIPNILVTTPYYIDFIKERFLCNNIYKTFRNYAVIPNIVQLNEVSSSVQSVENYNFFALGRMDVQGYNQKNFESIAQAIFILKNLHYETFRKVKVLVGGIGSMQSNLKNYINLLGISEAFEFLNSISNERVRSLQATSRGVLLVSRYEGQSMFGLEALAAGAPLIFSKRTGISDLVINGQNGFLIDPDDPSSITQAIVNLCNTDEVLSFKTESIRHFRENYLPKKVIEKFIIFMKISINSYKL